MGSVRTGVALVDGGEVSARVEVEAAGGVVWRPGARGRIDVLLIHRRRSGDWSLPKGKLDPGEAALAGALREVREETGLRCTPWFEVGETRYVDRKGRAKRVRYWAMREAGGRFRPNAEVDRVRWCPLDEALAKLTYAWDVPLLAAAGEQLAGALSEAGAAGR